MFTGPIINCPSLETFRASIRSIKGWNPKRPMKLSFRQEQSCWMINDCCLPRKCFCDSSSLTETSQIAAASIRDQISILAALGAYYEAMYLVVKKDCLSKIPSKWAERGFGLAFTELSLWNYVSISKEHSLGFWIQKFSFPTLPNVRTS